MIATRGRRRITAARSIAACVAMAFVAAPCLGQSDEGGKPHFRGLLGPDSSKIKRENGKTYMWAGGGAPDSPDAKWYDFTGSPIDPAELQFGIGKDRIKSIDDPMFVSPDDPRLLKFLHSSHQAKETPKTNDDIPVIGYIVGDEVKAFPVGLLDRHELVNDRIGGKPVTVGW